MKRIAHYRPLALAALLAAGTPAVGALPSPLTPDTPACDHAYALGTMGALACSGSWDGNNVNQGAGVLAVLASSFLSFTGPGGSWSYAGTTDAGQTDGPFNSVPAHHSGTLILDTPIQGPFAIALKSGTNFSLYLFDGGETGRSTLPFTTFGTSLSRNLKEQSLSHASLYTYAPPVMHDMITSPVPEPGTYALMLAGLGLVGYAVRRRRG